MNDSISDSHIVDVLEQMVVLSLPDARTWVETKVAGALGSRRKPEGGPAEIWSALLLFLNAPSNRVPPEGGLEPHDPFGSADFKPRVLLSLPVRFLAFTRT
jgi:hypothetical protein